MSRYKSVYRSIHRDIPESLEFLQVRILDGVPVRHDALNHDGTPIPFEQTLDIRKVDQDKRPYRGSDVDVIALTPGKKHSFDLPKIQEELVSKYSCRLLEADEGGTTSIPTIGEQQLRITEDCKLQWDTTGAIVGDRFMIKFQAQDGEGRNWKVLQTIQIVEDLETVCEVTPGSVYMEAFSSFRTTEPPRVPVRLADISKVGMRHMHAGGAPLGTMMGYFNSNDYQPGWRTSNELYNIDRRVAGTFLVTHSSPYFDVLPLLGPTYCPIAYELGCKDSPSKDKDGDGVCDVADNCPEDGSSRDQWDSDGDGVGDHCDEDKDGDGLPNDQDACPDSTAGQATDFWGCSVQDLCPCPTLAWDWESKVQCTRRVSRRFMRRGDISRDERRALIDQARDTVCPEREPFSWSDFFWFL